MRDRPDGYRPPRDAQEAEALALEMARMRLSEEMINAGITAEMLKAGLDQFYSYDPRFEDAAEAVFRIYLTMNHYSKVEKAGTK